MLVIVRIMTGKAHFGGKPSCLDKAGAIRGSPTSCSQGFTLVGLALEVINYISSRETLEYGDADCDSALE